MKSTFFKIAAFIVTGVWIGIAGYYLSVSSVNEFDRCNDVLSVMVLLLSSGLLIDIIRYFVTKKKEQD